MSEHYERHAEQVADAFLDLLQPGVKAGVTAEQRDKLAMMVEAAISTAVLEQLEHAADEIGALSDRLRRYAERYDKS